MVFALLLQSGRLPWFIWAAAGVVLVGGLFLFVFFLFRLKKGDQAAVEEDWRSTKSSLLGEDLSSISRVRTTPEHALKPKDVNIETVPTVVVEQAIPDEQLVQADSEEEPQQAIAEEEPEEAHFSDDVWAELQDAPSEGHAQEIEPPRRAPFVPPRVERIVPKRKPFEPPRVQPLAPREVTAPTSAPSVAAAVTPPRGSRPQSGSVPQSGPRLQSGSVLGLPAEPSSRPFIYGPATSRKAASGVSTLSNYGKSDDQYKSNAGTIVLVLAVLMVGGAIASYFYVPSVRAWVDEMRARTRGESTAVTAPTPPPTMAKIFLQVTDPKRGETKIKGTIYSLSDEPLPNLSVEIALTGLDGTVQTRTVQPKPAELGARQSSAPKPEFELTYLAKDYTSYEVVKLLSNGVEVPFSGPPKQQR